MKVVATFLFFFRGEGGSPKVVPMWELEAERINSLTKQQSRPCGELYCTSSKHTMHW